MMGFSRNAMWQQLFLLCAVLSLMQLHVCASPESGVNQGRRAPSTRNTERLWRRSGNPFSDIQPGPPEASAAPTTIPATLSLSRAEPVPNPTIRDNDHSLHSSLRSPTMRHALALSPAQQHIPGGGIRISIVLVTPAPATPPSSHNVSSGMLSPGSPAGMSGSPLASPSSGCCAQRMIPRPGFPADSCVCVYPIRLELHIYNVTSTFTNWSAVFLEELALQLGLEVIQIEVTSFHLNDTDLLVMIMVGPLTAPSFSVQQAETIKSDLENFKVHFNRSFFGNYTLISFQYNEPLPSSPSVQISPMRIPPLPQVQDAPQDSIVASRNGHAHFVTIIISSAAAVVTVSGLLIVFRLTYWKAYKVPHRVEGGISSSFDINSRASSSITQTATKLFTFDELREATNNFSVENVIGKGGFGQVFKGMLKDGTAVAIKSVSCGLHGYTAFVVEVEMLSRLHHRNLVKLLGYHVSMDSSQHLLCYELIPNGSLEAWLHGPLGANQILDWSTRLRIALDAARGLAYLHEDSQPCVIHRDFKASNILLENDFHAKVADFGLAKQAPEGQINCVDTQVMGTFGYVAPEYAMTGHLWVKSDVYSYGVVLLELLSGRKPVDMSQPLGQENLVSWAQPILKDRERLEELADPKLLNKYPREQFQKVAAIAAACVTLNAIERPTMGEVVQSLLKAELCGCSERPTDDIFCYLVHGTRSFVATKANAEALDDGDSSSVFSSGVVYENEMFVRTTAFSEDLREGR